MQIHTVIPDRTGASVIVFSLADRDDPASAVQWVRSPVLGWVVTLIGGDERDDLTVSPVTLEGPALCHCVEFVNGNGAACRWVFRNWYQFSDIYKAIEYGEQWAREIVEFRPGRRRKKKTPITVAAE